MIQPLSAPCCDDSEKALLCSMILDPEAMVNGAALPAAVFYQHAHMLIFKALLEFHSSEKPIDFVPLRKYFRDNGQLEEVGDVQGLNEIWEFVPTGANWKYYADIVTDMHQRRVTILSCQKIMASMYDVNVDREKSVRDEAERALSLLAVDEREKEKTFREMLLETLEDLEHLPKTISKNGAIFGIPRVDEQIVAMLPFENWMVAGESSSGKSAIAMQSGVVTALDLGLDVAVFSLEMEFKELIKRMLSNRGGISMRYMRDGKFPEYDLVKLTSTAVTLDPAPIHIFDDFDLDMKGILTKCRKLKVQLSRTNRKIGLIILDYLQLIDAESSEERKELEYSEIVRRCKRMTKEFECPVLGISQLNEQKKLYGARSIKHHLDGLILLDDAASGKPGHLDLCIVKMRNGEKGIRLPILFDSQHMNFKDRQPDDPVEQMPEPEQRRPYHNNANRDWSK